jgi:transposase
MRLFIGLDVSLAKTAICVISEHGQIVKEAQAASEPEALVNWVGELDGSIAAIGLEAGPLSQWLHHGLTDAGLDVVLMETRQVKGALKAMPIKTDRRDAEGIARLLHLGWFRPVHCKSVSAQEVRAVLGARKAVQQSMIALELSLRGLLRNFGLKVWAIRCLKRRQNRCSARGRLCGMSWPGWSAVFAISLKMTPCVVG